MFLGFLSTIINPMLLLYQRKAIQQTLNGERIIRFLRRLSSTASGHRRNSTAPRHQQFNDEEKSET